MLIVLCLIISPRLIPVFLSTQCFLCTFFMFLCTQCFYVPNVFMYSFLKLVLPPQEWCPSACSPQQRRQQDRIKWAPLPPPPGTPAAHPSPPATHTRVPGARGRSPPHDSLQRCSSRCRGVLHSVAQQVTVPEYLVCRVIYFLK